MKGIYLDQAATSFPKAPGVGEIICSFLRNIGSNINRGSYTNSLEAGRIVYETRELLCKTFNFTKPENVIFTKNITESLNYLIKGLLGPEDHVIVSSMEHNAVMRPLHSQAKKGMKFIRINCNNKGDLDLGHLKKSLRSNTKAVIMTHASNVCGTILPLALVGDFCQANNLFFIIDAAQSAGSIKVDFQALNCDALAFTGHKGLLGPQGIGGFLITDKLASHLESLIEGGTGSSSESEEQPPYLPDKFEAGTPNIPGIFGLHKALKFILETDLKTIQTQELSLTQHFIQGVKNIKNITLIGHEDVHNRTAAVSLDFPLLDNGEVANILAKEYTIMTRSGLHCAPSAHKTLGTFPQGTVRFSFGFFNTLEEVDSTLNALNTIVKEKR